MPVYRIGAVCTVALSGGGTTERKFLAILDDDVPMRDLPKHLTQQFNIMYRKKSHRFCLMEEIMDESGSRLDLVGLVRERLKSKDIIRVKGRQLTQEAIEDAAFSWFFSPSTSIAPLPLINQELTPAMSSTFAQALIPALVPSLVPALVPALTPALIQSVAALRRPSPPPSPPSSRSHRLITSHPHKGITMQDTASESETTTMNEDLNHVSEESSSSESDKDMDQDSSSESEDERPKAAILLDEASSDEDSSDSDSSDSDNDEDEHKKGAAAQIFKKVDVQTTAEEPKKDAAEVMKDNNNALVDMFKDNAQTDSDSDSSSDEDEDSSTRIAVPRVAPQAAAVVKEESDVEEMDTIINKPIVPTHSAPSAISSKSPEPAKVNPATSPIKAIDAKPVTSSGLGSMPIGQSTTSSASASSSPASSRTSSPTPVRSPAPSPAPVPRRESVSIFAAPAIIPAASPLSKMEPLSYQSSPYSSSASVTPATSPIMSRVASSSSSALKRPSTEQSRPAVSPDRPKKKQAGFAITVPQDHFRAFSPEIKQEYNSAEDSEEEGYFVSSQDFLYTALSRPPPSPARAFTPVDEDEEQDVPVYRSLNLVVKQKQDDQTEEDQSDEEQAVRRNVVSVMLDDDDEEESEKEFAQLKSENEDEAEETPMSITSSYEPSSSQVSLVDIKEEPLSQNPSSLLAKYRESEEGDKANTTAAPVISKISTTRIPSVYDDEEEEDEKLSPEVSPPGALLEYLKKPLAPPAMTKEQPGLSTAPKHPLSAPASPAPAPVPVPTPSVKVTSPSKVLSNAMSAYPTFASLASIRGPDVQDPTSNTDEIVAFLDKDMEGLSRDSSLTGPPYFLSSHPSVTTPKKATTPALPVPISPVLGPSDESTVSPELRPSVSPMVVPKMEDHHKEMDELDLNNHASNHNSQLISDSEDSVFNIPSAQQPVPDGERVPTTPKKAFAATNGWADDTRDAMDDYHSYSSGSDSDEDSKPSNIPKGMFGPNKIAKRRPEDRHETAFKDISLIPFSSQDHVPKRLRISSSSPSATSASGSNDEDSSDEEDSSDDENHPPHGRSTDPHPLDALAELPMMISSQSSLPSMPTLTALSQERNTKTKKMGSLEMALKQSHGDEEDDDDDDFVISIKRTGPTATGRSTRGRGGAASSPGRRGGRGGGVTIAAAGGRVGGVSNKGRPSGGGLEDLFA